MQTAPISLLVVDDEAAMRTVLRTSLAAVGYSVREAASGEAALGTLQDRASDLVLLDISMPGMGGIEACRRIRRLAPDTGILMVSVRGSENDKVNALEAGADDYVTKPFHLRELLARLRAVRRRTHGEGEPEAVLRAGSLELDLDKRMFFKDGEEVHLSQKEFAILAFLMQHQDVPVPHARLLKAVWGPEYGGETEYLRTYMKSLRKKIELDSSNPEYILTEPWVGYRFRNPSSAGEVAETASTSGT